MKKSKTKIALIWGAINAITRKADETSVEDLENRVICLEDDVLELIKADSAWAIMEAEIEDLERMLKAVDDRRIEAVMRADEQEEVIGRMLTGIGNTSTDYKCLRTAVDSHTNLHAMHNDLFKAQSNTLEDLRATVTSLVADKDALMSDSAYLYRRERELQTQVDDQAKALEHLAEGVESVAKGMVSLEGWMSAVETILSSFRK